MDLSPAGSGRLVIALLALAGIALLSLFTMDPGRPRTLTLILLAFFSARVLLGYRRSR